MDSSEPAYQQLVHGVLGELNLLQVCWGDFLLRGKIQSFLRGKKNNRRMPLQSHVETPDRKIAEFDTAPEERFVLKSDWDLVQC